MARRLLEEEMRQIRRFIVEERRRNPRVMEREIYERFRAAHPALADQLGWSRFRHHFRMVREVARAQGKEVHELISDEVFPKADELTLGQQLDAAMRQMDEINTRLRTVEAERTALQRELERARQAMSQVLAAITREQEAAFAPMSEETPALRELVPK